MTDERADSDLTQEPPQAPPNQQASRMRGAARTGAGDRQREGRAGTARLVRTIVLGALAGLSALYWVAVQFGVATEDLAQFLLTSAMFVVGLVVLGITGGVLLVLLKWLRERGRR